MASNSKSKPSSNSGIFLFTRNDGNFQVGGTTDLGRREKELENDMRANSWKEWKCKYFDDAQADIFDNEKVAKARIRNEGPNGITKSLDCHKITRKYIVDIIDNAIKPYVEPGIYLFTLKDGENFKVGCTGSLSRRKKEHAKFIKEGSWKTWDCKDVVAAESDILHHKTIVEARLKNNEDDKRTWTEILDKRKIKLEEIERIIEGAIDALKLATGTQKLSI